MLGRVRRAFPCETANEPADIAVAAAASVRWSIDEWTTGMVF
jgi:hypothetical protein